MGTPVVRELEPGLIDLGTWRPELYKGEPIENPPFCVPSDALMVRMWVALVSARFGDPDEPTVRHPSYQQAYARGSDFKYGYSATKWHRDGGGIDDSRWLVLWTNYKPTRIRRHDGSRVVGLRNYHVYAVRNVSFEHMPPTTSHERWFARAYVYKS